VTSVLRTRLGLISLAGISVIALAGCASAYEPQPPAGRVAKSEPTERGLARRASAFESFMRHARGVDPAFSEPSQVTKALAAGAAHEPTELEGGMIAYGALAALRDGRFVAGVREAAARGDLAERIAENPAYAMDLPGAEGAAALASGALHDQGEALKAQGERVRRASYSVQHQAWSKRPQGDARSRVAFVKRVSAGGYRPEAGAAAHLHEALAQSGRRGGGASSPVVQRAVAVAALATLGQEGRARELMSEPGAASCLRLAKLNLYQCIASAGPQYEDIYCLGQHAMADAGQCVVEASEAPAGARVTRASYRR
jgi:hypothetical protein